MIYTVFQLFENQGCTKSVVEYLCYLYVTVFFLCSPNLQIVVLPTASFFTSEVGT